MLAINPVWKESHHRLESKLSATSKILTIVLVLSTSIFFSLRALLSSQSYHNDDDSDGIYFQHSNVYVLEFHHIAEYESLSSSNDVLWESLLTSNGGFYSQKDEAGNIDSKGISMFHQLHCLGMLRTALQAAQKGSSSGDMGSQNGIHKHSDHDEQGHYLHCFDYLRQAILCSADGTFEPSKTNKKGELFTDGYVEHQCRDAAALYKLSRTSFDIEPSKDMLVEVH
ncbi:hypothetical protein MMC25_005743 [Agyrium rufum]|nr:hypothetical protein [Agyrium rufum]